MSAFAAEQAGYGNKIPSWHVSPAERWSERADSGPAGNQKIGPAFEQPASRRKSGFSANAAIPIAHARSKNTTTAP